MASGTPGRSSQLRYKGWQEQQQVPITGYPLPMPAGHCIRPVSPFDLPESKDQGTQRIFPGSHSLQVLELDVHGTPGSVLLTPVLSSLKCQVTCG